jgi:hypothetical protein
VLLSSHHGGTQGRSQKTVYEFINTLVACTDSYTVLSRRFLVPEHQKPWLKAHGIRHGAKQSATLSLMSCAFYLKAPINTLIPIRDMDV